ncbi:mediator of RNA polymerase II transcription subunit 23-like isoform X2 [Penaeus monodon]|uniref:mediator of RNA polymerase II transcription subunit 23-like isoform X2 n=1 Tax=Penaeus monodon TaxID=6687 RepID=UPI0018A729E6|nr:mediator of RNA polymerase II transcription subunit 23-like isoform X2 [Penaeus monodon]
MEEPVVKIAEAKTHEILADLLKVDVLQEALVNLLEVNPTDKDSTRLMTVCADLQRVFSESSETPGTNAGSDAQKGTEAAKTQGNTTNEAAARIQEAGVRAIVSVLSCQNNCYRAHFLASILLNLVNTNAVSPKVVCICLLADENLKTDHDIFWLMAFGLIKKIISGVDYKGVREIMKMCLDRARQLPTNLRRSQLHLVEALLGVMSLIFDRNASLLPGYFIVNELLKLYPDYKNWPHWSMSSLLTDFIDKFRRAAQMLSIVGRPKLRPIVEHSGQNSPSINSWKLDSLTLKFQLKGALPYSPELLEAQPGLLRYILKQPYSREMVYAVIDIQKKKQRCNALEEQLVELMVSALDDFSRSDALTGGAASASPSSGTAVATPDHHLCTCTHLSSLLIHFVLFQLISFPCLVMGLHAKLESKGSNRGRDHLMWVLLQFLSGSIQKNPFSDFLPILRLIEVLYPENEPLPIPDYTDSRCALQMSAMCILMHILKKAQTDNIKTPRMLPPVFKNHNEFLQSLAHNPQLPLMTAGATPDYRIALLVNAYSTNQEYFQRPILTLSESIQGNQKSTVPMPGINCVALGSTTPLSMTLLDSLTVHVKMSLIHNIGQHINKQAQHKSGVALAPALIETYARLLVYTEIESIGIKTFITNILPLVFKSHVWSLLHALLEMFIYRIHHSPPQYRVQLLSTLHHLAAVPLNTMTQMTQLHLCMESVALRLITGLGNSEVMPSLTRFFSPDTKPNLISTDSEELNRVLVLTMARAMHVTGKECCDTTGESARWCVDFLKVVMTHTPHTWANHTIQCFPPVIADFYHQYAAPRENMQTLKKAVEEEYRKWMSMSNETDIIAHFSLQHNTSPLFLCLLFKMVLDNDRVPPIAYKVLERVGPRQLAAHVRTLCDFLVLEFSNSAGGQHVTKYVETMNAIIWVYNIVPIDRLMLCLALRTQEGSEAHVCFFIIQLLLLKPCELRNRVQEFVKENSPDHWRQSNWYDKHMAFHRKFPEKFSPESILAEQGTLTAQYQTLPIYCSNVCLRFLPVLDIIIHRFLELHQVHKNLETILERLGMLYKFHDRPITYLYNTFHYYENKLRERPNLKRRLVVAVIMSQQEIHPQGWALTEAYHQYLARPPDDIAWNPDLSYYTSLVRRLVHTMQGKAVFPSIEWRFNEFSSSGAHALHVSCVELMALPSNPTIVANMLMDVLLRGYCDIPTGEMIEWVNAVGLILTWLPEPYWIVVHDRIIDLLQHPTLATPGVGTLDPFSMLNLEQLESCLSDMNAALTLAIAHAFWHHASFGQVGRIPQLLRERIRPILTTEEQLVVVCHLVGPFLQRFNNESARKVFDVTKELYEALAKVDHSVTELKYMDPICDVFYHIKYMFTGDSIKTDVEGIIRSLRPALQRRLRFITHLNLDSIENPSNNAPGSTTPAHTASTAPSSTPTNATSNTGTVNNTSNNTATASVPGSNVNQTGSTGSAGSVLGTPASSLGSLSGMGSSLGQTSSVGSGVSGSGGMSMGSIAAASSLASLLQDTSPINSSIS